MLLNNDRFKHFLRKFDALYIGLYVFKIIHFLEFIVDENIGGMYVFFHPYVC